MKLVMVTDCHFRNEEPFFQAGVALNNYIVEQLSKETESFDYLDGGDYFHVSKGTGRVNGEAVKFFSKIASMPKCRYIHIMQGNHDVKVGTGSALDLFRSLDPKIHIIDRPCLKTLNPADVDSYFYFLPYMSPYSVRGYVGLKSYGDEAFHKQYWADFGYDWDKTKEKIVFVSMHGGDETTGKFFMNADTSFLPGVRSNGHIHKHISKNHLPSASVTRRDEIDKKCYIRHIHVEDRFIQDFEIPLFLNYAQIPYGKDVDSYFESSVHIVPKESLIVDIYGHDDKDLVIKEYMEKWLGTRPTTARPIYYVGEVTPVERRGEAVIVEERDDLNISSVSIKELFSEFCAEKQIVDRIRDGIMKRICA